MDNRCTGFVEWWDRSVGRGSIVPLGWQDAVPVRREDLEGECRSLSAEQQVSFVLVLGADGFEAREVRP
ncbi:cold shock domain-containing protein [Streptomyces sp. NPDC004111]|uniref:cold shock domain-containing protein n=1 Tax=Streptomyces sp. NPDC004111 TaxID=3364690 RepID=UPI00367732A1